jgi:mannose-6-phosphate isomerase-like protein (cupin superfamily)
MKTDVTLATTELPRVQILRRVARYADLQGFSTGFDSNAVPNTERTLLNIMGYETPADGAQSPVGRDAAATAPIAALDPFNMAYARCKPGKGPLMHNHDTSETFVVMSGTWRFTWNEDAPDSIELGPLDVVSFPPHVARRFENITFDEPECEHVLLVLVGGRAPVAENTARSWDLIRQHQKAA